MNPDVPFVLKAGDAALHATHGARPLVVRMGRLHEGLGVWARDWKISGETSG
jgi:hypothetical protein